VHIQNLTIRQLSSEICIVMLLVGVDLAFVADNCYSYEDLSRFIETKEQNKK